MMIDTVDASTISSTGPGIAFPPLWAFPSASRNSEVRPPGFEPEF
jgi:hypothetical protein